jgi:alpha-tubulin suppressor-like RCC1 family protein
MRAATPSLEPLEGARVKFPRFSALITCVALAVAGLAAEEPAWAASEGSTAANLPIYQWGRPVAPGGPGRVPTQVQSFAGGIIDAGNNGDIVVLPDGTAWGWGQTDVATQSMTAVRIPDVKNVQPGAVDGDHDYAVLEQPGVDPACPASSTVMTWGLNQSGDLGIGSTAHVVYSTPQDVTALDCKDVVQLAAGNTHMFALTGAGQVYVWGAGPYLTLGLSKGKMRPSPVLSPALTSLTHGTSVGVELTAGSVTGGILVDGHAYTWGSNAQGQCGCGSTAAFIQNPTPVSQGSVLFQVISQGGNLGANGHTLALTSSGAVWAWGDGAEGQLGTGGTADQNVPVRVRGLPVVSQVEAGGMFSLFLDSQGNVWASGDNHYHEIGNGGHVNQLTPIKVLAGVSMISAGSYHSIAQRAG